MSNYSQITSFTPKDSLLSGNPLKLIKGADFDAEFAAISAAITTKADSASAASFLSVAVTGSSAPANGVYLPAANTLGLSSNSVERVSIDSNGVVTVLQPTSGIALVLNPVAATEGLKILATATNNAYLSLYANNALSGYMGAAGTNSPLITGAASGDLAIRSQGGAIRFSNNSGGATQLLLVANSNSNALQTVDDDGTLQVVGWRDMPLVSFAANTTTTMSHRGKTLFHASGAAHTITIDSNANVAYPLGAVLTFCNTTGGGALTIAITSDTLTLMPGGTTGSRTLNGPGIATAVKVATTTWFISGVNLS